MADARATRTPAGGPPTDCGFRENCGPRLKASGTILTTQRPKRSESALTAVTIGWWSDVIEGGRRLYRYDGRIPATLCVTDEVTLVWGVTGEMRRRVLISENDTVQLWALETVERYRERAEAVAPQAFA